MTHRIVVDVQAGTTTQVEYTAEEQAIYDATVAAQAAETPAEVVEIPAETLVEPAENT
jgi:hypothetical protein